MERYIGILSDGKQDMHKLELGSETFALCLCLTQRNLPLKERQKLVEAVSDCLCAFEGFVRTAAGGKLLDGHCLEMAMTICGKTKMTSLNGQYRNRNRPTDVLSFPLHENLKKEGGVIRGLQRLYLGDIFICREVAFMQAKKFRISYYEELGHLFVHGFLHLLGYDHEISLAAEREMVQREKELLENIMGGGKWKNLSK